MHITNDNLAHHTKPATPVGPSRQDKSEAQFMPQVTQGDQEAFDRLHQRYILRITGFFRERHVNSTAVDDLTQEVFTRIWEKRGSYQSGTSDHPYLLGFARLVLLEHQNELRSKRIGEFKCAQASGPNVTQDSALTTAIIDEEHETLKAVLDTLPEKQRQVLALKYLKGQSSHDMAKRLDCSESTVRGHCRLGLMKLREWLKDDESRAKTPSRKEKHNSKP